MRKRKTKQEQVLREVFARADGPLGPQEATVAAKAFLPSIGVATVYRTIRQLVEERWLVQLNIRGQACFEMANLAHHHHFHCLSCDKLYDLAGCLLDFNTQVPDGFVLAGHEITLNGICAKCSSTEVEQPR